MSEESYKILHIEIKERDHRFIKQAAAIHGMTIKRLIIDAVAYYMNSKEGLDEALSALQKRALQRDI